MEPAKLAWQAAGEPIGINAHSTGRCARCAETSARLTATSAVISKNFTAFDTWRSLSSGGLCPPCTWIHTDKTLRNEPLLIDRSGTTRTLSLAELAGVLASPLPHEVALTVPLRPGRKHLLPEAAWGHIRTDEATMTWTTAEITRFAALRKLRALTFTDAMLIQPAPTWSKVATLPRPFAVMAQEAWETLEHWRTRAQPWMHLALRVTKPKAATS